MQSSITTCMFQRCGIRSSGGVKGSIVKQFGNPQGILGWTAGRIMAARSSNRRRNLWAVSLLNVQGADQVLEIGCGPGIAIEAIAGELSEGHVCGIDRSALMLRQAQSLNAEFVRQGRATFRQADAVSLPFEDESFDKVLSVNAVQFWDSPLAGMKEVHRVLRPHGIAVTLFQPRWPKATDDEAQKCGQEIELLLRDSGFINTRIESLSLTPVAAVAAIGIRGGE